MINPTSHRLARDHGARTGRPVAPPAARQPVVASPTRNAVTHLPDALNILATRMHAAVSERRDAPPGSERYRRADERVAYLNELYVRLQRRMEVPVEIWLLDGDHTPPRGRRSRPRHSR